MKMNCERFIAMLDDYMDGTLTKADVDAMEAHARECRSCASQMAAADFMMQAQLFADTETEDFLAAEAVEVPLEVQSGWRKQTRAENRRKNTRKYVRRFGAAAAAVVFLASGAMVYRNRLSDRKEMPFASVQVDPDGITADSENAGWDSWIRIRVKDGLQAYNTILELCSEYEARLEREEEQGNSRIVYIRLPDENYPDFLTASEALGENLERVLGTVSGTEGIVCIELLEGEDQ